LDKKGIDDEVLNSVQEKLMERKEMCFNKLKNDWERQQTVTTPTTEVGQTTIFRILEESVGEGDELHNILTQVRNSVKEGEIDENNIHQIFKEITRVNKKKQPGKKNKKLPSGILTHKNTLFFIEKEQIEHKSLLDQIESSQKKLTEQEQKKKKQWLDFQHSLVLRVPSVADEQLFVFKGIAPDFTVSKIKEEESMGKDFSKEDLEPIRNLAKEVIQLFNLRERQEKYCI